jgi:hypothetical protein
MIVSLSFWKHSMLTTLQILTQGLALIRDPKHWVQRELAATRFGMFLLNPSSERACSWCSIGALMKAEGRDGSDGADYHAIAHLEAAMRELRYDYPNLARFNDAVSHSEVIKVWEKAIENYTRNPGCSQGTDQDPSVLD